MGSAWERSIVLRSEGRALSKLRPPRPLHCCSWDVVCRSSSPFSVLWIQPFSRSLGFLCRRSHFQFPLMAVLGKGPACPPLCWILSWVLPASPHCGHGALSSPLMPCPGLRTPPSLTQHKLWVRWVGTCVSQHWGGPRLSSPPVLSVCAGSPWPAWEHRPLSPRVTRCLPAGPGADVGVSSAFTPRPAQAAGLALKPYISNKKRWERAPEWVSGSISPSRAPRTLWSTVDGSRGHCSPSGDGAGGVRWVPTSSGTGCHGHLTCTAGLSLAAPVLPAVLPRGTVGPRCPVGLWVPGAPRAVTEPALVEQWPFARRHVGRWHKPSAFHF